MIKHSVLNFTGPTHSLYKPGPHEERTKILYSLLGSSGTLVPLTRVALIEVVVAFVPEPTGGVLSPSSGAR